LHKYTIHRQPDKLRKVAKQTDRQRQRTSCAIWCWMAEHASIICSSVSQTVQRQRGSLARSSVFVADKQ